MKLVRWNPNRDLLDMQSEFDRFFEPLMGHPMTRRFAESPWAPAADVRETEDGFSIRMDLPGLGRDDFRVTVFGDTVTIRGERKSEERQENEAKGWHRVERYRGNFERTFALGTELDASRVKATYRDGVLDLEVPKSESAKPKEIEIEVEG